MPVRLNNFGALEGFDVNTGTIVVGSSGLDTRNISMFDMVSRTAELYGAVYGGDQVNMILGRNNYDYKTGKAEAKADNEEEKPKVALDGKSMGSLYAGRIFLQSTEKGVGVNSEAVMLADAGDFEIDVNGDLVLKNIQAKEKGKIKAEDINIKEKVLAEKSLDIKGKNLINEGDIVSQKKIALSSTKLENNKNISSDIINIESSEITNKDKGVIAGENINITESKTLDNEGTILGEKLLKISADINNLGILQGKNEVDIKGNIINSKNIISEDKFILKGNLDNKDEGYIYSKNSEIIGNIENKGNISSLETIEIEGNVVNKKTLASGEKLEIKGNKIGNFDVLSSKNINITTNILENSGELTAEELKAKTETIINQNILYGKNNLILNAEKEFSNSQLIQGENDVSINSENIINTGNILAGNALNFEGTSLENREQGQIISEGEGIYNVENVKNENIIQSNGLQLKNIQNTGTIISKEKLTGRNIQNKGTVSALKDISFKSAENKETGKIVSGNNIFIETSLFNEGVFSAENNIAAFNVTNSGNIIVNENIELNNLNKNSGVIEGKNIDVINENVLDNTSGTIAAFNNDSSINIRSSNIINTDGKIQSQGDLNINVSDDLNLTGTINVNKKLDIRAKSLTSNTDIESTDVIINVDNDFINNNKLAGENNVNITGSNAENNGLLGSIKNFILNLTGKFKNTKETTLGNGENLITTKETENKGFLTAQENLKINSSLINNNGQIAVGKDLTLTSKDILNNENSLIYSAGNMEIRSSGNVKNNKAEVYAGGNINIEAEGTVTNNIGSIESLGKIDITAEEIENIGEVVGDYSIVNVSGGELNVDTSKINQTPLNKKSEEIMNKLFNTYVKNGRWTWFHNTGVSLAEGEKVISNYISNQSYLTAGGDINLTAKKDIINREANMLSNGNINITADTFINENLLKDVTTKITWKRGYEFHGGAMHILAYGAYYLDGQVYNHNEDKGDVIIKQDYTWQVGSDKATTVSALKSININAKEVGNGVKSDGSDETAVEKKNINIGEVSLNKNNIKQTGIINTEDYIKIPEGDKGLFKVNENITDSTGEDIRNNEELFHINTKDTGKPGFSYLIETNVKFIDKGYYLGSEYFFSRINFNPEKDIRLLGDSFYETQFVNRAILESTGQRYLNGAANDKEQMQILYDNSIKAMNDLQLSLGVALTSEQINNLKEDIIWYVEEEVNGINVLVPKVYLSKETLASLGDSQTGISAGENLVISAITVNNTGKIETKGNIAIDTSELINKSVLGDYKGAIKGNDIKITSVGDIVNIGASINAENNLDLTSIKGNIDNKTAVRENVLGEHRTVSKVEFSADIKGNNININAGNNFNNTGALTEAKENLNINAKDINLDTAEVYNYETKEIHRGYSISETKTNIGGELVGKDISLNADKNINVKGSDVIAENDLNVKAGENINVVASVDTDYYEQHTKKKKSFGRSKSSTEVKYTTTHNSSNLIGNNVSIESGNDTAILGSNIQAGVKGKAEINAGGDIVQGAVKDIDYSYKKTTKKGFLGLSGSSKSSENYKEEAISSNSISGTGGTVYDSKNNMILEGVTVVSTGNITLKGQDVIVKPVEEKSFSEVKEKKKGFVGGVSGGNISLSYGKSKDEIKIANTENVVSNITSQGKVTIEADGGKTKLESVDIYGEKGIDIKGTEGVELTTSKNKIIVDEKHKSSSIGISIGVHEDIKNTADNIKNVNNLVDFNGDKYDVANTASNLVGAIRDGADTVNRVSSDNYKKYAESSASQNIEGISKDPNDYISISAGINKNKSESHFSSENTVQNNLTSKEDININSSKGNVIIEGTNITTDKDLNITADKNIYVQSSKDNYDSSHSSSSKGINADLTISTNPTDIIGGITVSESMAKGNTEGTININSEFNVGGTHKAEAGEKIVYEGANIKADKVDIRGEEVIISSNKDTEKSKNESKSESIKFTSTGIPDEININYQKGKGEKNWVDNQTTIIAERGGIIESKDFINSGAVIGSLDKDNKLIVKADNVTSEHLKDKDVSETKGGGISSSGKGVPNISVVYDEKDKRQNTNSTAVNTEFIVDGENRTAEELGFNTDLNKSQEITKNEEKHLNAELHTDLANQEERDKITEAGEKLGDLAEAITNPNDGGIGNTYKENRFGNLFNKFASEQEERLEILGDPSISDIDKRNVLNDLVKDFLLSRGYEGEMPQILIGDKTESVDGRYNGKEYVFINRDDLNNSDILSIIGHELGHMNTYDIDEKTAENVEEKINTVVNPENTNGKYSEYLDNLRKDYGELPDEEETKELQKDIPDEYKEKYLDGETYYEYNRFEPKEEKIKKLAEKFGVSEAIVKDNYTKYVYYNALEEKNTVYKTKADFEKFQAELKQKIESEKDPIKKSELEKELFFKLPESETLYHNVKLDKNGTPYIDTSFPNEKYINNKGQEAVFNKETGKWVDDGINDATYNVGTKNGDDSTIGLYVHMLGEKGDVNLWIEYGVGPHDKLTKKQREELTKSAREIYFKIKYNEIK